MEFRYNYGGDSTVDNRPDRTAMSFAPDTLRQPTYFRGDLRKSIPFREAISSMHDVVVSDLRWKPKDKTEYLRWRQQQDEADIVEIASMRAKAAEKIKEVQAELTKLDRKSVLRHGPFMKAKQQYFQYLLKRDYQAWIVLDPVITVHPDEVFFECFSKDESTYGRLGVGFDVFQKVGEFACGTTNIDYSDALYAEFQKIRGYKTTTFNIDPSGFEATTTGEDTHKEVKIDLPDSWVRGFLQVSSAMALPALSFQLHPLDVYNICFILRRRREIIGPRGMRYILEPGKPVRVVFEPWGTVVNCPRSIYQGQTGDEVRVWGRRRLMILERLIPVARSFTVHVLGYGMPSFYVADLGDMSFTLGLSGWTSNDWSGAANFDLLAPRAEVDIAVKERVFAALQKEYAATPDALARKLKLKRSEVLGALAAYTQAGRAIWDLNKQCYRLRELSREPLPIEKLMFQNPREQEAMRFVDAKAVTIETRSGPAGQEVRGEVKQAGRRPEKAYLKLDADERISDAKCSCRFFTQNKLRQGPCEHILAIRLLHSRQRREQLSKRWLAWLGA